MSLEDRLNLALRKNKLQPVVQETKPRSVIESKTVITVESAVRTYKTLKEGLKSAHKHRPDDFGTTVIVVEEIEDKIQLPMKIGKHIVDDIQKRTDGRYEVHLVND
tara:strand:+ start:12587 stop:12904 length:318 start_codon:yes stop_codon:yes gene_type:complete